MPRKPRQLYPGALYHVTSRGNARQMIFRSDEDRERFVEQLGERVEAYGVVVYAFVLMDNHYHLLIRTPRGNLDRFMQRLNTSYALYYRYKHGKPGHVFQGRYTALVVRDDSYLLALSRYIHLNPIKTEAWRGAGRKEQVAYLRGYRWSSYPSFIAGEKRYPWLSLDVLQHYGRELRQAARRYRAYTEAMILKDDDVLLEELKQARTELGAAVADERVVEKQRRRAITLSEVDRAVSEWFKVKVADLKKHGHVVGTAKRVALEVARRVTELPLSVVGEHYGGVSAGAVAMNQKRLRPADMAHITALVKKLNS